MKSTPKPVPGRGDLVSQVRDIASQLARRLNMDRENELYLGIEKKKLRKIIAGAS